MRGLILLATTAALTAFQGHAAPVEKDLRDLVVGMSVTEIPSAGYADLVCDADRSISLRTWGDWKACPADASGSRTIAFGFAPMPGKTETRVAGHPVLLAVSFGGDGTLTALRIRTDPSARLFIRKKAVLLGPQARSHYGDEGWNCTNASLAGDEESVAGVAIKETCTKSLPGRMVTINRVFLKKRDRELKDFESTTDILIAKSNP